MAISGLNTRVRLRWVEPDAAPAIAYDVLYCVLFVSYTAALAVLSGVRLAHLLCVCVRGVRSVRLM